MSADFYEYAFSDPHGHLEQLNELIERCLEHAQLNGRRARFVGCGDYVDRGPDSAGVVRRLRELEAEHECIFLGGNHEQMMIAALADVTLGQYNTSTVDLWWNEGGRETLRSYGVDVQYGVVHSLGKIDAEDIVWLGRRPTLVRSGHRVYVHAGLMPRVPLEEQDGDTCLWIRDRFLMVGHPKFKHLFPGVDYVVHGHTPIWGGKPATEQVEENGFRLNLDCGTAWTGVLSGAVFDPDVPGGPIELIRVEGAPSQHDRYRGRWR